MNFGITNYPLENIEDYQRWFFNYQFYIRLYGKRLIVE